MDQTNTNKLGLVLSTRQAALGDCTVRQLVDLATATELAGYDSVWAGESVIVKPRPDPFTFLAACAVATSTIELGTAASLPATYNPLRFAHQTATLDQLSEGRLVLGVGAGYPGEATEKECERLMSATTGDVHLCKRWSTSLANPGAVVMATN